MQILKFCESSPQQLISKKKISKFCWSLELKSRHIGRFRRHHGPDGPIFRDVQMSDSLPPAALKLPMRPHCAMGTPFRGSNTVFTVVFGVFLLFFAIKSDDFGPCPLYMTTCATVHSMMSPFSVKGIQKTRFLFCHL